MGRCARNIGVSYDPRGEPVLKLKCSRLRSGKLSDTRRASLLLAMLALVFATAGSCDTKGTVIKLERYGGVDERCKLTIRPDHSSADQPNRPFIVDVRGSVCDQCPVDARWPECAKPKREKATRRAHA